MEKICIARRRKRADGDEQLRSGAKVFSVSVPADDLQFGEANECIAFLSRMPQAPSGSGDSQKVPERVIFNFHFPAVYGLRLIRGKDVCGMLQISRAFLSRLSRVGELRTYTFGRLRRYALDDVLDYLSKSELKTEAGLRSPQKGEAPCITSTGV